jgi:hypothetical protein
MRELACFLQALSTSPIFFNTLRPMGEAEDLLTQHARRRLGKCWRRQLGMIEKDGRTNREIWDDYMVNDRCKFYEHAGERCNVVVDSVD